MCIRGAKGKGVCIVKPERQNKHAADAGRGTRRQSFRLALRAACANATSRVVEGIEDKTHTTHNKS